VMKGGVVISESYTAGWNRENGHHEKIVPGYGLDKVFGVIQSVVEPDENNKVEIITTKEIPFIKKGTKIFGSIVKETYRTEGAKVLAKFNTGEPAITYMEYGKGKAVQIGTYLGIGVQREKNRANGELIAGLVEYCIKINRPSANKKIRIDVLQNDDRQMLIIQNLENKKLSGIIRIPEIKMKTFTEQFSKKKIKPQKEKGEKTLHIGMDPREVKVYIA
jgi:hypothetical protein